MKHQSWNVAVAALAACTFIYACGQESNVGSRFVKSEQVAASKGAAISVSAAEEPELAGSALDIPAGALGTDTTITLELGLKAITESPRGPVAIWGPSGTIFSSSSARPPATSPTSSDRARKRPSHWTAPSEPRPRPASR